MTYKTEEEILNNVRSLWKKYGNYVLYAATVVLIIVTGWKWFESGQQKILENSSNLYNHAKNEFLSDKKEAFLSHSNKLVTEYSETVYGDYGRFLLSSHSIKEGNLEEAEKNYNEVIKNDKLKAHKYIAYTRLARIKLHQGKYDDAIKLLDNIKDPAMDYYINELKGNIYKDNKKFDQAKKLYELALTQRKKAGLPDEVLRMKIDNLPGEK